MGCSPSVRGENPFLVRRNLANLLTLGALACCLAVVAVGAAVDAKDAPDVRIEAGELSSPGRRLAADAPPVVCLIHTSPLDERSPPAGSPAGLKKLRRLQGRLEELSGLACLLVHSTRITRSNGERPNVQAMVLTADEELQDERQAAELATWIRETKVPLIALGGGGYGQICRACGGKSGVTRPLPREASDDASKSVFRLPRKGAFVTVRIVRRDRLFQGLPEEILVSARHGAAAVAPPKDFVLLAGSGESPLQVVKHRDRLLYGISFRPEAYDYAHPHGRILVANFFRIAGIDVERTVPAYLDALRSRAIAGLADRYDPPSRLRLLRASAVCLIDLENPDRIRERVQAARGGRHGDRLRRHQARLAELSGMPCLAVHYTQIRCRDFDNPNLRAIVIGGLYGRTIEPLTSELVELIRTTRTTLLGICGGHQLIGKAYGATVAKMRRLRPGEKDPGPDYWPGFFKEWDYLAVRILRFDSLFEGLTARLSVCESHVAEIKVLPEDFLLLAGTAECRIQVMKHRRRMVYGVQFHPERYDDAHPAGRILLRNFFRLAAEARR